MKVIANGQTIELGATEAQPTIGIIDYSRRETDDYGVTTVIQRGFARRMSVRIMVPTDDVDQLQRRLASLRATPAQWIADEQFASLSFMGFYKEFQIDLAAETVSFCTLTVEGLAETEAGADTGGDPAPDGKTSTLRLLQPATVTEAMLTASNVPENDYAGWAAGTTYVLGARVIAAHCIYESAVAGNVGNDPATGSSAWLNLGPTNRWAMFDEALGSATEQAGSVAVMVDPIDPINAVALLDVTGTSVRVQAGTYDRTVPIAASPGMATFLDLPDTSGPITVTINGSGTVSVGTMLIGRLVDLGVTEASPTATITDYSRKETDDFGDVTVVERAWAKRMSVRALLRSDAVDLVASRIASVRARPCLWIGEDSLEALSIYGFFKDFSIEVGENVSALSLSVEGLSTAGKIAPIVAEPGDVSWTDIKDDDPLHPKPEDGATVGATPAEREDIAQAGFDAAAAAAAAAAAQSQITQIESSIAVNFSQLNAEVEALEGGVALAQTNITSLQTQAGQIIASVGQVGTRVDQVESSVSTLNGSVSTLSQTVTNLNGTVSTLSQTVTTQGGQISIIAQSVTTLAGSLSTLTARVNASQTNLLTGGGLENGFASAASTVGFIWTKSPEWGPIATASDNGLHVFEFAPISSVQVGARYWIACDPIAYGSSTVYCDLLFVGSSGIILDGPQNPQVGQFNFSSDDTRRGLIAVSAIAPAGTTHIIPRIVVQVNDNAVAGFRRVKVETGPTWTPFSSEASIVQTFTAYSDLSGSLASLSTTVSTQGGSITTLQQSYTSLNGTVSTLSQTVTTQGGQISSLQQVQTTQAGTIAQHTTDISTANANISTNAQAISSANSSLASLTSTVSAQGSTISQNATAISTLQGNVATLTTRVAAAGANILPNGGLENGFSTGIDNAGGFQFTNSPSWGPTALAYSNGLHIFSFAPVLNPQVGGAYTFAVDPLQFGTSDIYCDILCMNGSTVLVDGVEHGIAGQFDFDNTDTRRGQIACTVPSVPSGTDRLVCRVFGTVRDGQPIGFRRAKLENGSVWSRYSAEATAVQQFQTLSTLDTQYASLSSTVGVLGATVSANSTAISTLQGQYASLSSSVSVLGGTVSQQSLAIADINGKVSLYWQVVATGPGGEVYVRLVNSAGQSGFFIGTDLYVDGNATLTGTVNPEALALSRFVKRIAGNANGSPSAGQQQLIFQQDFDGATTPNGSYSVELTGSMVTNVGYTQQTISGTINRTNYLPDGGLLLQLVKSGTVIAQYSYSASEFAAQLIAGTRTLSLARNLVFDAPSGDASTAITTLRIYAIRGNQDSGPINDGDIITRNVSALYSDFSLTLKSKWTFI